MEKYVMAIDQGTTSTRVIFFDHQGKIKSIAQRECQQYFPNQGWVEQDGIEIWKGVLELISECFIQSDVQPNQIDSIGITNQRETTILWDKHTGKPVYHALVWQSRQTQDIVEKLLKTDMEKMIKAKTGLPIDAYFSATKIMWLLENIPELRTKVQKGDILFGSIDTWLIWNLTGRKVHVTDYTNASRTMLFNIHTLEWDKDILNQLKIPENMLPNVKSSSEIYGLTDISCFLGVSIPIASIAGDQQAALFGQGCVQTGSIKNTYGTGSFILMNTGNEAVYSTNGLITTLACNKQGKVCYALEGSVFTSGSAIQWLRDGLNLIDKSSETEALAFSTKQEAIFIVPAFVGLGAPYWDADVRGAIFGITRGTTKAELVKATLESIAYQTRDIIDTMIKDTQLEITHLKVDGGTSINNYLLQFQADILNLPVMRPQIHETTALGVAYLAGLATGFWSSYEEICENWMLDVEFISKMPTVKRNQLYYQWKRAVDAARFFC